MSDEKGQSLSELEELDKKLKAFRKATLKTERESHKGKHPIMTMMWLSFYIVSELVGGVLCGLAIGWGLDKWLNTYPVFIAIFLVIGSIASVLNVIRYLKKQYSEQSEEENG